MREREELRRAVEQSEQLLSRVRLLEEQNSQLNQEKNEVATKYRAVSPQRRVALRTSASAASFPSKVMISLFFFLPH